MSDDPTNVELFLQSFAGPLQTLEDAVNAVIGSRNINDEVNCVGVALTALGKLVGRPREGVTDDDIYRRYVRAQIAVNESSGGVEDLLVIADLVVHDGGAYFHIFNVGGPDGASLSFAVENVTITAAVAEVLVKLLKKAVSGGVKIFVSWLVSPIGETFRYDVGPGYDVGKYAP